jgi:hypothetical protein
VAIGSAAGKHDPAVPDDAPMEDKVPDVTDVATQVGDLQDSAGGRIPSTKHDKTKKPMSDAVWQKMKPVMHILGDVADTYERFGKCVQPYLPKCSIANGRSAHYLQLHHSLSTRLA